MEKGGLKPRTVGLDGRRRKYHVAAYGRSKGGEKKVHQQPHMVGELSWRRTKAVAEERK